MNINVSNAITKESTCKKQMKHLLPNALNVVVQIFINVSVPVQSSQKTARLRQAPFHHAS